MEYGRGRGRGRGRGGYNRDRSFSPPPQRRSPDYGNYRPGPGRGGGRFGRRDDNYRDDFRGRDGPDDRPDDRGPQRRFGRDNYNRHGGYGRDGSRERDRDREFGGYGRGPQRPDSPGYEYDRRGSQGPEEPGKPLSKTMFIKKHIDDDVSEEEIDRRYTEYLAGVYKSKNKAEFERQKNDDVFKRKFDPFVFKEEVESRNKTAQTTAVTFAKHMAEGKYDWTDNAKSQLMLPSDLAKARNAKTPCPVIAWLPDIIAVCWKVASELVVKLDREKGVTRTDVFDWIDTRGPASTEEAGETEGAASGVDAAANGTTDAPAADAAAPSEAPMEAAPDSDAAAEPAAADAGDGAAAEADSSAAPAQEAAVEGAVAMQADGVEAEAQRGAGRSEAHLLAGEALEGDVLATRTGQLDVMLEYLWQVHGVDFYSGGGGELNVELYRSVKERLLRHPPDIEFRAVRTAKPQSGALVDEKKRDAVIQEFHFNVSQPWIERLKRVDADTQRALDLDAQLDAAVEVKVQEHYAKAQGDQAQGSFKCQYCDKKFKGAEYLAKHTNNKHHDELEKFKTEQRDLAREKLFFETFENHLKQEQEAGGGPDAGGGPGGRQNDNAGGGGGPPAGPMGGPPMGGPMGGPMMPHMMMNPMQMMQMMQMAPQMGMLMQNMMMGGGGMPGRGMMGPGGPGGGPPGFGGRGGGGGRGMGRGRGRGREYFDFDAPSNHREQLNYGDI